MEEERGLKSVRVGRKSRRYGEKRFPTMGIKPQNLDLDKLTQPGLGKIGEKYIHPSLCFKYEWKLIKFAQFSN